MHTNLKRFYNKKKNEFRIYFVTFVTKNRFPYFENHEFKEILYKRLKILPYFHNCILHISTIQIDHVHILIQPLKNTDISKIISFIKRNFSRNINDLSNKRIVGGDDNLRRAKNQCHNKTISKYSKQQRLIIKKHQDYLYKLQKNWDPETTPFSWQLSFHDHIIRDYQEFKKYYFYIKYNSQKHKDNFLDLTPITII